jgi:DNA-binding GntR family transcriptional regulator
VLRDPAGLVVEHRAMAAAVRDADLPRIAETVSAHIAGGYRELVLHLDERAGDDPFDLDAD